MSSLNQRLFSNSFYLALIQAANLGLPLLTFPYLVRVLGIELFGVLALATAVMHYGNVLIDYGFNLTATRDTAKVRDVPAEVSSLFCRVQMIKLVLASACAAVIAGVQVFTSLLSEYALLYWLVFLGVVCTGLFPVWLFQGMERMRTASVLNVLSKILFTIGIFVFVQTSGDYLYVPMLTFLGALFVLVAGTLLAIKEFQLKWYRPSLKTMEQQLRASWYVFLSQLKITLFSNTNVVLLGFWAGPLAVGYYAGAEKLMRALAQLQTPVTQALFPQISQLMTTDEPSALKRLKKIAVIGGAGYLILLVAVFLLADWVSIFMFGKDGQEIAFLLKWMLPIPLCIFLNNIFGTQILLNLGRDRVFFFTLLAVAIFSVVTCSLLAAYYQHFGATIALLITEVLLMLLFAWFVRDKLINN